MAKTVTLDGLALGWAQAQFRSYYEANPPPPPHRLDRREFAAFPFGAEMSMRRHTTLRTPEEFQQYLVREVPRHVYYSTAYYRYPAEATMSRKEWLGADLVFDLDADHLRGAERLSYADQLRLVKTRLLDLVDDFLVGDFGIPPEEMRLVFSGGRGYHVHVRDERFLPLTSPERRELVDYIQGTGFDARQVVAARHMAVSDDGTDGALGGRRATVQLREIAPPDAAGWRGRTTRALLAILARWEGAGPPAATEEMVEWGIPKPHARRLAKLLLEEGGVEKIRSSRTLPPMTPALREEFLGAVVPRAAVEVQGETDAPVTTDVHRLIRLPGSLHGGTGLRVLPLTRDALERFDPLRDGPFRSPAGDRVGITLRESVRYPWGDAELEGSLGDAKELPTAAALFLILRGEASLRA
ncbi:MAG TPA: DNA primase small subunit PriS [Thermoplasmata archaeon]|nr:DNA primase small subunit PriS [Thermoplasmata archaeon]